jgi:hypothetical protein
MARKRRKIQYCYEDYMKNISAEEKAEYQSRFGPLIDIIERSDDDREVMTLSREFDQANGTKMFDEAVHLTVYCIACSKFDCDC